MSVCHFPLTINSNLFIYLLFHRTRGTEKKKRKETTIKTHRLATIARTGIQSHPRSMICRLFESERPSKRSSKTI